MKSDRLTRAADTEIDTWTDTVTGPRSDTGAPAAVHENTGTKGQRARDTGVAASRRVEISLQFLRQRWHAGGT